MLKRVVVGVAVILVGAVMLAPSKVLALKKKDIVSKVFCECQCWVITEDEVFLTSKKFLAPGGDGTKCSNFDKTKCRTKEGTGALRGCESLVERGGPKRVSPEAQPLAPVAPKSVAPKSVAPSVQPLAPVQ